MESLTLVHTDNEDQEQDFVSIIENKEIKEYIKVHELRKTYWDEIANELLDKWFVDLWSLDTNL